MLLDEDPKETRRPTSHSLKATTLSWCAKFGIEPHSRLILGHHSTNSRSADIYARELLASPLREYENMLQHVRQGTFCPDNTRSGMVAEQENEGKINNDASESIATKPEAPIAVEEEDHRVEPTDFSPARLLDDQSSESSESSSDASMSDQELADFQPEHGAINSEPDVQLFQHHRTKVVHKKALGTIRNRFHCGIVHTSDFREISESLFLQSRKCLRCETVRPIRDYGALAAVLKRQRTQA